MSVEAVSLFFLIGLLGLMACGVPLGFAAGALASFVAVNEYGVDMLALAHSTIYSLSTEYLLVSVPMFILMASLLEKSTIAHDLYEALQRLVGQMTGGVAVVTLALSIILAAMSGIIGGEIVLLGLVALPQMLRLKYDRRLAIGTICAGGSLGTMVPPSIVLIVYGLVADVAIHTLFIAAVVPALLLSSLYFLYIYIRCRLNPALAPPLPENVGSEMPLGTALFHLLPGLFLLALIMFLIYGGVTSVTEAACIGVVGALFLILIRGEFSFRILHSSLMQTLRACGIILWVTFGANILISVYNLSGGRSFVRDWILAFDMSPLSVILLMMLVFLILGMIIDWIGIVFLTMPIFVPIIVALGYSPIWFGVLFCMSMQVSFLSPPFAPAAFILKSVAPPDVTVPEIFRSVWPFIILQCIGLMIVVLYPRLALWLPGL
jgi:tripartite ATP-independent transporter DctM subunit